MSAVDFRMTASCEQIAQELAAQDAESKKQLRTEGGFRNSKHFHPLMLAVIAFGFATFLSISHLYYVKVFLDVFHISTDALKVVQILFLVWNAVNDPLMGYMQDIGCGSMTWMMDRRKVILYAGPVFAFGFLIFWFPWSTTNPWIVGLHLLVALFIFDTLLTLVLSAFCGLLVEASEKHHARVRCLVYAELFEICGGLLIIPINLWSKDLHEFGRFQIACGVVAVIGAVTMALGAYQLKPSISKDDINEEINMAKGDNESPSLDGHHEPTWRKAMRVSWQIVKEVRFICLVGSQFFRMMRFIVISQFLIILVESLVSTDEFLPSGSGALSMFYAIIRTAGSLLFLFMWLPTAKLGAHLTMLIMSSLSLLNVIVATMMGRDDHTGVAAFIALEMTLCMCGIHAFSMLIGGEVVDTDTKEHKRASPLTTLIFTLKALFTKPAEQLAPVFFIIMLDRGGYSLYKQECLPLIDIKPITTTALPILLGGMGNSTSSFMEDGLIEATTAHPWSAPHCVSLRDSMHFSLLFFTFICIIGEAAFVVVDFWYKKKVMNRSRGGSAVEPAKIKLQDTNDVEKLAR